MASQRLNEGGLSSSWRTMKEIAASVWYTTIMIPLGRLEKVLNICDNLLLDSDIQNDRLEGPLTPWISKPLPSVAPLIVDDSLSLDGLRCKSMGFLKELLKDMPL